MDCGPKYLRKFGEISSEERKLLKSELFQASSCCCQIICSRVSHLKALGIGNIPIPLWTKSLYLKFLAAILTWYSLLPE